MEDFWVFLSFPSDLSICSTFARALRSLREKRKTQKSSPISKEKVNKEWSKRPFWSKRPCSEPDFSICETKMVHFGPFWPDEVHLGPCMSANHALAIPDYSRRIWSPTRPALSGGVDWWPLEWPVSSYSPNLPHRGFLRVFLRTSGYTKFRCFAPFSFIFSGKLNIGGCQVGSESDSDLSRLPPHSCSLSLEGHTPKKGRAKGDGPKVTYPNLRFPAVFCKKSSVSCALHMLEFPGEGVNLRKSAVFCDNLVLGSLCRLGSVTLSAP